MDNIIKTIELDLDGKIVKLTLKQARSLCEALSELFGKEKEHIPYFYSAYPRPYWIEVDKEGRVWPHLAETLRVD